MIKITFKENYISIKGHADYEDMGKDIVCAGVSSIITTTINAILKYDKTSIEYTSKSGFVTIKILKDEKIVNLLINNMKDLLKELQTNYQKNIKIEEVPYELT